MTFYSLVGALIFLGIGIVELAVVNRSLYPSLRWRYEKAKTTQEQGISPKTIMLLGQDPEPRSDADPRAVPGRSHEIHLRVNDMRVAQAAALRCS